jgi:hypothetical protein
MATRAKTFNWHDRVKKRTTSVAGLRLGFRSGLEANNAKFLEAHGAIPVRFEELKVRYLVPESFHTYTWDFTLPNGIIVETKGVFDAKDRAKHLLVKEQYPELDIRLVFTRSKATIAKGSKTTLADWCEKHGFKYADKLIPESWLREAGPGTLPEAVIAKGPRR